VSLIIINETNFKVSQLGEQGGKMEKRGNRGKEQRSFSREKLVHKLLHRERMRKVYTETPLHRGPFTLKLLHTGK
jgi:hypothetical protein